VVRLTAGLIRHCPPPHQFRYQHNIVLVPLHVGCQSPPLLLPIYTANAIAALGRRHCSRCYCSEQFDVCGHT